MLNNKYLIINILFNASVLDISTINLFTGVIRSYHLSRADALLNKLKIKLSLKKLSDRSYLQQLFSLLLSCIFKLKASNGNHLNTPYNKGSPS